MSSGKMKAFRFTFSEFSYIDSPETFTFYADTLKEATANATAWGKKRRLGTPKRVTKKKAK